MCIAESRKEKLVAGIFLTALTDKNRLREIIIQLRKLQRNVEVFIRTHPASVVNSDLSQTLDGLGPINVSNQTPLTNDIERADLAIVGSSTVAIEILRGGRPVLYEAGLDDLPFDYNGFLQCGLVMAYPEDITDNSIEMMRRFYLDSGWTDKMRYYDSGYQRDEMALKSQFIDVVRDVVHV